MSFPGEIPLPPDSNGQAVHPTGQAAYDAQTMAYYQTYYQQMAAAGYSYPTAYYPAASSQVENKCQQQEPTASSNEAVDDDDPTVDRGQGCQNQRNVLPVHGNSKTMNLNSLLLTNIQQSQYFRTTLYGIKSVNELMDEIWSSVKHMEPWEKGSRSTSGQTGMCGSVRGVGAGGIVSTPFCILYKLFTLKPTRKQIMQMIKTKDSPFIRATGLLYIRYTQAPDQLWTWFNKYLSDPEKFEPRAGFGHGSPSMTIGDMVRNLLTKLDWFSTLFPRIPVPIQKDIDLKLREYDEENGIVQDKKDDREDRNDLRPNREHKRSHEDDRYKPRSRDRSRSRERDSRHKYDRHERKRSRSRSRSRDRGHRRDYNRSPHDHRSSHRHSYRR